MKVALRVDASQAIGTGHLRRCLALAHAVRRCGGEVHFVVRDLGLDAAGTVTNERFAATILPAPELGFVPDPSIPHSAWAEIDQARDAAETAAALQRWRPDWLVVDSYAFDARWHQAVRAALGCRVAAIDDLADRPLAADLVIDHNFHPDHAAKYVGLLGDTARLLGGPRFALLGPVFAGAEPMQVADAIDSIGVFLGGVDADGLSGTVLAAIRDAGFAGGVEIVSTTANPHLAELRAAVAADGEAALSLDLPDLAGFFARHQLQIGAGGGAAWERCCLGAPTILLVTADNQRAVVPALADAGVVATCDATRQAVAAVAGGSAGRFRAPSRDGRTRAGTGRWPGSRARRAGYARRLPRGASRNERRLRPDVRLAQRPGNARGVASARSDRARGA